MDRVLVIVYGDVHQNDLVETYTFKDYIEASEFIEAHCEASAEFGERFYYRIIRL